MRIMYFPHYCGGRILYGLWSLRNAGVVSRPGWTDQDILKACTINIKTGSDDGTDQYASYIPNDLKTAQILVKRLIASVPDIGVIYAVTNSQQGDGVALLESLGFKESGRFHKTTSSRDCISWTGDYNKDVRPILGGLPEEITPKFSASPSVPLGDMSVFGGSIGAVNSQGARIA